MRGETFEHAEQHGAVRPWAGDGGIEVIAAALGRKVRRGVGSDAVAEHGVALEIEPARVVLAQHVVTHPASFDELAHYFTSTCRAHTIARDHSARRRAPKPALCIGSTRLGQSGPSSSCLPRSAGIGNSSKKFRCCDAT